MGDRGQRGCCEESTGASGPERGGFSLAGLLPGREKLFLLLLAGGQVGPLVW